MISWMIGESSNFMVERYLSITSDKLSDEICSRQPGGVEISYDYLARRGIPLFVNTSTPRKIWTRYKKRWRRLLPPSSPFFSSFFFLLRLLFDEISFSSESSEKTKGRRENRACENNVSDDPIYHVSRGRPVAWPPISTRALRIERCYVSEQFSSDSSSSPPSTSSPFPPCFYSKRHTRDEDSLYQRDDTQDPLSLSPLPPFQLSGARSLEITPRPCRINYQDSFHPHLPRANLPRGEAYAIYMYADLPS